MRTTAVLDTEQGVRIVGGGKRDLSPAQRASLKPGDVAAKFPGQDAEVTTLRHASENGLTPKSLGTTRDICPNCQAEIEASGGKLIGPRTAIWPKGTR